MPGTLTTADDIRAASGDDPLVAHLLAHWTGVPAYEVAGAVCLQYHYWENPGWVGVGPAADVAALLDSLADDPDALPGHLSVPVAAVPLLRRARFDPGDRWAFRWTDARVTETASDVSWLGDADLHEVSALLDADFPDASIRPGSRHARRWAGIRVEGALVACGADSTGASDVGFMASLATSRGVRGTGYGRILTAWLTNALLDEHPRVALWQYSDNAPATALYDRLGYHDDHQMVAATDDRPPPEHR